MVVEIKASSIRGSVMAPASKSSMQRACALALLSNKQTTLINPGKSNDDIAALNIIQSLGAAVVYNSNENILIKSPNLISPTNNGRINCGESGLSIRMFAPIAAISPAELIIEGTGSLLNRPMHFFDEIFPKLGVSVYTNNGLLPVKIKGPLQPKNIVIDGSQSSQFLTGLLMTFAKTATEPVTISVKNLTSRPYIDLTLQMMADFGFDVENNSYQDFIVHPKNNNTSDKIDNTYKVESDWSSASFLLVAGAIAGNITVKGLDVFSLQADKAILKALIDCGTNISIEENKITINAALAGNGKAFHFSATHCPDLFPPLVALAAYCNGTTVIEGVSRLKHKESNRALTLQQEFRKLGIDIKLQDDLMLIEGGDEIKSNRVFSHHDHRIAMACAVAALRGNGQTVIEGAEAVNKSYPGFYQDLKLLNADVSLP